MTGVIEKSIPHYFGIPIPIPIPNNVEYIQRPHTIYPKNNIPNYLPWKILYLLERSMVSILSGALLTAVEKMTMDESIDL